MFFIQNHYFWALKPFSRACPQKISIDGKIWKSDKTIFSNDILQSKQVKIVINSLEVYSSNEELRFKSSLNYLVLDENFSVPFWFGSRRLTKS